jgi:hypothetical protein
MIEAKQLKWLLSEFDLGASTAENDPLLETAKIETQEFHDLYWHDRIDIIKGMKGAGKTALYRLFYFLQDYSIEKNGIYCVFGIEPTGDPIFRIYEKEFEQFTEIEFQNFWSIYFISLVYQLIHKTPKLKELLADDLKELDDIISEIGLKFTKKGFGLKNSISSIINLFNTKKIKIGVEGKIDSLTGQLSSFGPTLELTPEAANEISIRPIYLADFKNNLTTILKNKGIKVWVMLDRLDEVFAHRSNVEKIGLRGLLKASYNFSRPNLRTKIFLRDDIMEYLVADGFTAFTHISDRCSQTMSWSKEELQYLIIKRISALKGLVSHFEINKDLIDKDKSYREQLFYKIFPERIGKTLTMDWIYTKCADGNDIVTPRDMIDLFKFAKAEQFKQYKLNPKSQDYLISAETFKKAIDELSKHKKEKFLFAEFPHLKEYFLKFEGKYSEYDKESIAKLLNSDHIKIIDTLKSIGFLKHISKSGSYKIPTIWRKGLNIRSRKISIKKK